jgi:hypothetical protein
MATIVEKIAALNTKYGSKEQTMDIIDMLQKQVAFLIRQEQPPAPPLKKVFEFEKIQLILDKVDVNYLLAFSKHSKRSLFASRTFLNDMELKEMVYNTLIFKKDVDVNNKEENLKTYIEELVNEIANVTQSEIDAIIPTDETLNK